MIKVTNLAKHFQTFRAVDNVSFAVAPGELFGFLGPNGAGKTTTINMLCALLPPSGGDATINGHHIVREPYQVRSAIGLVFQDPSLDERLTGWENLEFHGWLYNLETQQMHARMRNLLQLMELTDWASKRAKLYSGGMKRRLEIARGLLHHPKVLFLDEPTLGLDPQTRQHVWAYLNNLRKQESITLFLTTHYLDEAEQCDRIAVIDHGKIIVLDTPARLKQQLGGDVIYLRTADNAAALTEINQNFHLQEEMQRHKAAHASRHASSSATTDQAPFSPEDSAPQHNGFLKLNIPNGEALFPQIIQKLSLPVLEAKLIRPTLEDVFLHLTGRSMRDENGDGKTWMRTVAKRMR